MKFLQKIGKSLMLPVAVLPICGILMGIGYWMCPASMQGDDISGIIPVIGFVLVKAGGAIIDNMCWLFVIGVSVGMSDDNHGASCLSGLVSYLVITTLLSTDLMSVLIPTLDPDGIYYLAFSKIQNQFIAIFAGVLGAFCYNKYRNVNLPKYLSFFSGRRFVIIASAVISIAASVLLGVVWPLAYFGLVSLGKWILGLGGIGVGIYAFLNRLLIPFGMHHALNNVFWFDTIGIGDLTNFWSGKTSEEAGWSLGMYMSGFFPCMMFGIPGAALAMIKYAKNRKKAIGILLSTAICAFICGVTEPFEYSFMFVAFPLYVVYSLLYGIFATITYYTGFRAGFSFSAGATDLLFSASLPAAAGTWKIIPLGLSAFAVFYLVFAFMLKKFNFATPGNEADTEDGAQEEQNDTDNAKDGDEYVCMAQKLLPALGGSNNLVSIDCCATRLRLEVVEQSVIDHAAIKKAGAMASKCIGKNSCQIIIGVTVQQVCDALKSIANEGKGSITNTDTDSKDVVNDTIPRQNKEIDLSKMRHISRGEKLSFACDDSIDVIISDPQGIHARPAAKIVETSKKYESNITMCFMGKEASMKSITSLMSLGVTGGSKVTIKADGPDAKEALEDLKARL